MGRRLGNTPPDTNTKQRKRDVSRLGEYTDTDLSSGRSPLIHHVRVRYHQGTQEIRACYVTNTMRAARRDVVNIEGGGGRIGVCFVSPTKTTQRRTGHSSKTTQVKLYLSRINGCSPTKVYFRLNAYIFHVAASDLNRELDFIENINV